MVRLTREMPTTEEVAAVVKGLRLIDDNEDVPQRVSSMLSISSTTSDSDSSSKDSLLVEFVDDGIDGDEDEESHASIMDVATSDTFDVDILEEHSVPIESPSQSSSEQSNEAPKLQAPQSHKGKKRQSLGEKLLAINLFCPKKEQTHDHVSLSNSTNDNGDNSVQMKQDGLKKPRKQNPIVQNTINFFQPKKEQTHVYVSLSSLTDNEANSVQSEQDASKKLEKRPSIMQNIIDDFTPKKGDQKILRAIGRTATVNAAVLLTAATGGAAGAIGYATGGAITSKRLFDGLAAQDEKEVTKSLAVYTCATGASIGAQALTGVLMIGLAGASLPLAGAVAFGVGCVSGISAGALSEWTVDKCMDDEKSGDESKTQSKEDNDSVVSERTDDAVMQSDRIAR